MTPPPRTGKAASIREQINARNGAEKLVNKLFELLDDPKTSPAVVVQICASIADRLEGKPVQLSITADMSKRAADVPTDALRAELGLSPTIEGSAE